MPGFLENTALFCRLLHVGFQRHQSFFARFVQQVVHHLQRVDIGLLAEFRSAEDAADSANDFLDDVQRVRDQNRAERGAADDDQFGGLDQHLQVAVLHQIAGDDATEYNDDADNRKHSYLPEEVAALCRRRSAPRRRRFERLLGALNQGFERVAGLG